jgi:hypothetical protein
MADRSSTRFTTSNRYACTALGHHFLAILANSAKPAILVAAVLLTAGCSGEAEQKVALRRSNLAELGLGYQQYDAEHGRAPASAAQLAQFMSAASDEAAIQAAVKSLEEGDVVMFWNGVLAENGGNGQRTLGFEASVPGSGGYVVTADGSIRLITARQFAETPTVEAPQPSAAENQ